MPFFDKIRQALGFSDGEDDIDDAIIRDDTPSGMYRHIRPNAATAQDTSRAEDTKPAAATEQTSPATATDEADRAAAIFDRVLEVFNQSLPDFLKQSVDPEAQRKYLYKSLDDGLKAYIANLKDQAAREAEARWRKDNDALQTSVKNLEQRAREIEDKRTEISQKQMSSDRQRRALSERVHDLESTVARLEAEKEQFELERQSMVNKLKVAAVYEKENTELHEQIEQMVAKRSNAATEAAADSAVIEDLNAQVAEAQKQAEEARKQTEEVREQIAEARKQADEAKKQAVQADEKRLAAEQDIAKLNDQILELQIELEAAPKDDGKAAVEALNAQVMRLQEQITAERRKNVQAQSAINELQRQIEEEDPMDDPEIQRQLKEIQDRLDHYEQQKKRNEDTIASLKSQLEEERRKNATATAGGNAPKNKTPRPVSSKPVKSAAPQDAPSIDDILGDTDWVVRQDNSGRRRSAERTKPKIDDDPQMKLF